MEKEIGNDAGAGEHGARADKTERCSENTASLSKGLRNEKVTDIVKPSL